MLLTDSQLHEIRQVIADHHSAFVANTISPAALTQETLTRLQAKGLVAPGLSTIEESYLYGHVMALMESPDAASMTYAQFRDHVRKNPIPLSEVERRAMSYAQHQAAQYVVGLGNKVNMATGQVIIEADSALRAETRRGIQDATAQNIAKRETVKQLASDLGWMAQDWSRDWERIAITEKHNAMMRGVADNYAERFGPDVWVFKRPMDDACKHCNRLYLGPDQMPRIFKLSTLEANGTNVGRKAMDWLPVVGATHPHCACQLGRIPEGWGFDKDGSMVPGGKLGVRYADPDALVRAIRTELDLVKGYNLQGHRTFQGLAIAIENRAGTYRHWHDAEGNSGRSLMHADYGYVKRTTGADEDEVDVFIGPDSKAANAFLVHQQNPHTGVYDEDKVMLGFTSLDAATEAYRKNYDKPDDYLLDVSPMPMAQLTRWLAGTETHTGEMMSKGPHLVIPIPDNYLEKSEIIRGTGGPGHPAESSRAGFRNPGVGTISNFVIGVAAKLTTAKDVGFSREKEELMRREGAHASLKRDQSDWDVNQPVKRNGKPIIVPDTRDQNRESARDRADDNRGNLENRTAGKFDSPENKVPKRKKKKKIKRTPVPMPED